MNPWQTFLKIWAGVCVLAGFCVLYYSYQSFYNHYEVGGISVMIGGIITAFGLYLLGRGFWFRRKLSLWAWFLTIPLAFPVSFMFLYGAFDGGPPLGAPPNWVLFLEATLPIPFAIITSILLAIAYKKVPSSASDS